MNENTEMLNPSDKPDYEKLSYGKVGYKRIQRLRKKGKRRGIEVPPLGFELTKPEKPRVVFLIAAIVGIILFVGILVGTGFLAKLLIDLFSVTFEESGGLIKTLSNPSVFFATAGLSFLPVLLIILAYLMLILIALIPFFIALYCYRFARNAFYMARCSKEEFAKSEFIWGRILTLIGILAVSTGILIVCLLSIDQQAIKTVIGLIYAGIVIIFGGLLALIVCEKAKCKKWFESLDEDKKQNYLAHENALRKIKSRLRYERRMWDNLFR